MNEVPGSLEMMDSERTIHDVERLEPDIERLEPDYARRTLGVRQCPMGHNEAEKIPLGSREKVERGGLHRETQ